MNRAALIEAMARAMFDRAWGSPAWDRQDSDTKDRWREVATAALSAIEALGATVVPVEATREMCRAGVWALDKARERDGMLQEPRPYSAHQKHAIRFAAMAAKSPFAKETT